MRFAIIPTDALFLYSCILDNRLLEIVRMRNECTSLLMNILTSSLSEYPVLHVRMAMSNLDDHSPIESRKARSSWNSCLGQFRALLDNQSLNLKHSKTSIVFT